MAGTEHDVADCRVFPVSCWYRKRSKPYFVYFCGVRPLKWKFLWLSLHRALGHNLIHQRWWKGLYYTYFQYSKYKCYIWQSLSDVSLLHIPGYKLIHQGSRCTRHGGLVIYLHEQYTYKLRNMYTRSDIWEGLFIDVSSHNLHRPIIIGNIYRPPHNNNSNANIETFIEEMSPIINTDRNPEYDIFERITVTTYEKHFQINAWKWTNININSLRGSQQG